MSDAEASALGVSAAAVWEQQIARLELEEVEIHRSQLKLIVSQTKGCITEVGALRQEIDGLRSDQEALRADLGDVVREVAAVAGAEDGGEASSAPCTRLASVEVPRDLEQTSSGLLQAAEAASRNALDLHRAAVNQRVEAVDGQLRAFLAEEVERLVREQGSLERSLQAQIAELAERFAQMEVLADRYVGKTADEQHCSESEGFITPRLRMPEEVMLRKAALPALAADQALLGVSEDDFASRDCDLRKKALALLAEDAAAQEARKVDLLKERVDEFENLLSASSDRHSRATAFAMERIDKIDGQLTKLEDAGAAATLASHSAELQALRGAVASYVRELRAASSGAPSESDPGLGVESLAATVSAHTAELEALRIAVTGHAETLRAMPSYAGENSEVMADSHTTELQALRGAVARHANDLRDLFDVRDASVERFRLIEDTLREMPKGQALEPAPDALASLRERASSLERAVGELRIGIEVPAEDPETRCAANSDGTSAMQRVDSLESLLVSSLGKHAEALQAAHADLEQMNRRLAECEEHVDSAQHLPASGPASSPVEAKKNTQEAVEDLEPEWEALKDLQAMFSEPHVAGDVEPEAPARGGGGSKLDRLQLGLPSAGTMAHSGRCGAAAVDPAASRRRPFRLASLPEEEAEDELESAHLLADGPLSRVGTEAAVSVGNSAADVDGEDGAGSLAERVARLESALGDNLELLHDCRGKMELTGGRLQACEDKCAEAFRGLEQQLANVDEQQRHFQKAFRDSDAAGLSNCGAVAVTSQRLEEVERRLERLFGENADARAGELEHLKATLSKQLREFEAMKRSHTHSVAMAQRLERVERTSNESAARQAKELAAARVRLDQLGTRLSEECPGRQAEQAREALAALREQQARERQVREAWESRLKQMESQMGGAGTEKHRGCSRVPLMDRLEQVEKALGEVLVDRLSPEKTGARTSLARTPSSPAPCPSTAVRNDGPSTSSPPPCKASSYRSSTSPAGRNNNFRSTTPPGGGGARQQVRPNW